MLLVQFLVNCLVNWVSLYCGMTNCQCKRDVHIYNMLYPVREMCTLISYDLSYKWDKPTLCNAMIYSVCSFLSFYDLNYYNPTMYHVCSINIMLWCILYLQFIMYHVSSVSIQLWCILFPQLLSCCDVSCIFSYYHVMMYLISSIIVILRCILYLQLLSCYDISYIFNYYHVMMYPVSSFTIILWCIVSNYSNSVITI